MTDFEISENGVLLRYRGADTKVVIPQGVRIIGKDCFRLVTGMNSVVIPSSVAQMEENAFYGCFSLQRVTFGGTIEAWKSITFHGAFSNPLVYAVRFDFSNWCKTIKRYSSRSRYIEPQLTAEEIRFRTKQCALFADIALCYEKYASAENREEGALFRGKKSQPELFPEVVQKVSQHFGESEWLVEQIVTHAIRTGNTHGAKVQEYHRLVVSGESGVIDCGWMQWLKNDFFYGDCDFIEVTEGNTTIVLVNPSETKYFELDWGFDRQLSFDVPNGQIEQICKRFEIGKPYEVAVETRLHIPIFTLSANMEVNRRRYTDEELRTRTKKYRHSLKAYRELERKEKRLELISVLKQIK